MTAAGKATAVIAAAGAGERLGAETPKALAQLAGRPLVAWCLDAFVEAESAGSLVVAAPPGREDEVEQLLPEGVSARVLPGGATRSESVAAAMQAVESELVVVHDAARPLVTPELIDEVIARLEARPDADGVIAAAPITDTVKRSREPRPAKGDHPRGGPTVAKTESRDHLWAAQTPQAFRTAKLREALSSDPRRVAAATDEAMLIEKAGGEVLIHPAPARNIKVTTPEDLRVAQLLLAAR